MSDTAAAPPSESLALEIGFGVLVDGSEPGTLKLSVLKDIIKPAYDGPAIRAFMEETAVCWLEQVAPHRLNYGADDR